MKTSSCKAKGRRFQQDVAAALLAIGTNFGLQADDIKSTSMGVTGVDVQFSPAARAVLGSLAVECKNREALNVSSTFQEHAEKYKETHLPLLFHKSNRRAPMVTLYMADFMLMLHTVVGTRHLLETQ